jgi:hypothetical protein
LHLARGEFLEPRLALAALELGEHVGRCQAVLASAIMVEPQVGNLTTFGRPGAMTTRYFFADLFSTASPPLANRRDILLSGRRRGARYAARRARCRRRKSGSPSRRYL